MGGWPTDVEEAFLELAQEQADQAFRTLLTFEPKEFGGASELPALTLYAVQAPSSDVETSSRQEVEWTWRANIYVDLRGGYQEAQEELKRLWPRVLRTTRVHPALGLDSGADDRAPWAALSDPGGEPQMNHDERLLWKSLQLVVRRLEP